MNMHPDGRPPFRADHIGSLLRPQALRRAFRSHAAKEMSDTQFRAAQDAAIRDVIKLQEDCGLQVVTDGEFRRISFWEKFVRLTQGLVVKEAAFRFHDEHGHESDFTIADLVAFRCPRSAAAAPSRPQLLQSQIAGHQQW